MTRYEFYKNNYTEKEWKLLTDGSNQTYFHINHDSLRISDIHIANKFLSHIEMPILMWIEITKMLIDCYHRDHPFQLAGDGDGLGFIVDVWRSQEDVDNGEDVLDSGNFWFDYFDPDWYETHSK